MTFTWRPAEPYWQGKYEVNRPGQEKPEVFPVEKRYPDLLNELGAEGWELSTVSVLDTVVSTNRAGFQNAGMPVSLSWTFKRQAS
ncbi:hypothetical protein GCM10010169_48730 [Micromonospora fulviviridis]|uniref:hypothetical protein n=1 Tax=Micromonospora fulviviridis TaxID=47860 RepID=UPI00166B182A|nr:hypothetical protein [Micromonospora fulviviridis]GGR98408.1 hypothetical protein GCM10010169_48730 [Micromonospora fulviviridis]